MLLLHHGRLLEGGGARQGPPAPQEVETPPAAELELGVVVEGEGVVVVVVEAAVVVVVIPGDV